MSEMIYDDILKAMFLKRPELIIPLVNMAFHTDFSLKQEVKLYPVETVTEDGGGRKKRTADSLFTIEGKLFHIEFQSNEDGAMIVRMVEYALGIAYSEAMREHSYTSERISLTIPRSAVLYLRSGPSAPDRLIIEANLPNGTSASWDIPVLKLQEMTVDDLIENKLVLLFSFFMLRHEKLLPKYEAGDIKMDALRSETAELNKALHSMCGHGVIDEYVIYMVNKASADIAERLTKKYDNVRKEVTDIMSEYVIDFPGMREWEKAYSDGIAKGRAEGITEGIASGILEGIFKALCGLVEKNLISVSNAAKEAGVSVAEFKRKAAEYAAKEW